MITAIVAAFLAVMPGLSYGGDDPRPAAWSAQDQQGPPAQSPIATIPVPQTADPAKPAAPPAAAADPSRMAAPPVSGGARIPGAASVNEKTYIIGAEDVLVLVVWGNGALSGPALVRPDGRISVGLVGEISAAGLTPEELSQQITDRLKAGGYLKSPQVTVIVQAVNSKKFFIQGEVNKPGAFSLFVPTTVLEALVNAGGFKDFANKKDIRIMRGAQRFRFNYNQVIQGKHREQNLLVEPGDIILVK